MTNVCNFSDNITFYACYKINVIINRNLNIDEYIFDLSQNAGRKLSILARLVNQNFERKRKLMIAFVE